MVSLKKDNWDICMVTLDIEFQRDWSDGLDATLGDGHLKK